MNFLRLWLPDCFPSEAVVSFSRYVCLVGFLDVNGAASWPPVIISVARAVV